MLELTEHSSGALHCILSLSTELHTYHGGSVLRAPAGLAGDIA